MDSKSVTSASMMMEERSVEEVTIQAHTWNGRDDNSETELVTTPSPNSTVSSEDNTILFCSNDGDTYESTSLISKSLTGQQNNYNSIVQCQSLYQY